VRVDEPPYSVRERRGWARILLVAALLVVPVAIHQWPWDFLPLRWQYPFEIRRGERIVEAIDRFEVANARLPSIQELGSALPMEDWPCAECYDPRGPYYSLIVTAGFDYSIWYDPQARAFRRSP
jgi:hypothetical protein